MEIKGKLDTFREVFEELRAAGKVRTQAEFADIMGVSRNAVSLAMNGRDKYLTASIVSKAVRLRDQLLKGEKPVLPLNRPSERDEEKNGIFIPRETLAFYESLARACENLSGIVSRLMPGGLPTETGKKGIFPED